VLCENFIYSVLDKFIKKYIYIVMFCFYVLVEELGSVADRLVGSGLKASTMKTYASAQRSYLSFCDEHDLTPLPSSDAVLLLYVAFLHKRGLKGSSIRVYLSGVRNLHVLSSCVYPEHSPKLQLALRGAVKLSEPPVRKLPITFSVLLKLFALLDGRHDELMLKSVMSLAFFGCFRAGELCLSDSGNFDKACNLTCGDIVFSHAEKYLTVLLKKSKTDKCDAGVKVHVGCSTHEVCAYCIMTRFADVHPNDFQSDLPLFVDNAGTVLRNSYFQSTTKLLLTASGFDASLYSGHSFRAGGATSAADAGFSDWEIKMLGRWASNAYNVYLRNPKVVCSFAERLIE
jgi:hypothetical protein